MCGKENPPELENCQFCQARLKPLVGQPSPDDREDSLSGAFSFLGSENQSDSEIPEWLRDLRSDDDESQIDSDEDTGEDQPFQEELSSEAQEEQPEWLSDLRDDAGLEAELSLPAAPEDEGRSDFAQELDSQLNEEQLPEWLEGLRSPEVMESQSSDEQEEYSEWLDRIRRRKEEDERIAYQASFEEEEDIADSAPSIPALDTEESEIEPSLTPFDFDEPGVSIEPDEPISEGWEPPPVEAGFDLEDDTPIPTPEADESSFEGPAVPAFDADELQVDVPISDAEWLRDLKEEPLLGEEESEAVTRKFEEVPSESLEGADLSPDSLPEWLAETPQEPEEVAEEVPDVMPEWLAEAPEEPETAPEEEPEVMPDWLAEATEDSQPVSAEEPDKIADQPADEVGAPGEPMPDWLQESMTEETTEQTPSTPLEEEQLTAVPGDIDSEEMSDWMVALSESADAPPVEDEVADIQLEKAPYLPMPDEDEQVPPGDEGLAVEIDQDVDEQEPLDDEPEPDLTPAELPDWLESMRPVETATPVAREEDADALEIAGPLAGLSGVLAAEPGVTRHQKDSVYLPKLQLTSEQRAHINLLKELVTGEGKPSPIPKQSVISSQNILRWAIALVLIIAILWPAIITEQQVPLPTFSQETRDVNSLINNLPEQARLLVAFDYQPGLAAEMDSTAAAVMDHLMLRGAYLTLVSTSPTGPLVAERFLSQTQSTHSYSKGEQYINMGYIPGGAAGLLSMAVSPQRTIPYTTDGVAAWATSDHNALPPLEGIAGVADFSMVLVIVDDPDVARAWVEQVQPYLDSDAEETPLVMVVSAQAEPLIRPYYQATPKQLQGIVSGMRGGASYDRLTGRESLPSKYWDAFSTGLSMAAVLIAVGGVVNAASVLISRRDQSEGESQT
jgi:hypothetical protein